MTFDEYLSKKGVDAETAAKALGKTKAYVHMLIAKSCTPSLHLAAVIEHWSGGEVPIQVWPDWAEIRRGVKPVTPLRGRPRKPGAKPE